MICNRTEEKKVRVKCGKKTSPKKIEENSRKVGIGQQKEKEEKRGKERKKEKRRGKSRKKEKKRIRKFILMSYE